MSKLQNKKRNISKLLEEPAQEARELARELGLDPYPVKYWVVDNDEMNELIAYNGFQHRYPHWRFGMQYERQAKMSQFGGGKAFEIVNNDNPAHAFLQQSNSTVDQKAVITHVEAHADFFKNNKWFVSNPNAAEMLEEHGEQIEAYMREHGRKEVEFFIDHLLCLMDNIDQYSEFAGSVDSDPSSLEERIESLDISDDTKDLVFDEEWIEEHEDEEDIDVQDDLMLFLLKHGKQPDDERERAVEFEDWQKDVIRMLRKEAYYFAPQKMTKVMNEGWAAFWESIMMGDENFAGDNEIIKYADHQSRVLNSPGFNPYKLGKELWEYIENTANRKEVLDKLLRVEGVMPQNFRDEVNFKEVYDALNQPESFVPAKRHYSLTKPQNRGFLQRTPLGKLKEQYRYIMEDDRYASVEEALEDVDYGAGWERMREVRESHNDITFIDEFLTEEFVVEEEYFTYEYDAGIDEFRIASKEAEDVKRKLLLKFTNFGKPSIRAADDNYKNKGELLLEHDYNGVMLKIDTAKETLKRIYELWGRPVNLKTIVKTTKEEEEGRLLRYDGEGVQEKKLAFEEVKHLDAGEIDYDTKPDDWI